MTANLPPEALGSTSVGVCPTCGANLTVGDRYCGGCGAPAPEAGDAQLLMDLQGVTVGDYEILGVLGRGGMGLVYLAHDITLSKKVAIKVLPPSMLLGEQSVERFRREARIAASLRHRHITSVFALKETTKLLFFVMEYVEGRTLDAVLQDERQLPVDAASAVLYDAMNALTYAHRREVVHRDLKPGNMIIDVEGLTMITDFGVAKVSTVQGLTTTGSTVGSPKYMSPEQWSGKATHHTDQYALGCVAYQLLTGQAPFEGETLEELMKQQLFDAPRPLTELRPDCPEPLANGIARMLEKEPGKRWPSLDAARQAMGLQPPGADDPAREQLAKWAARGHDVRALPKTPRSPIPISKVSRPVTPTPSQRAVPTPAMHEQSQAPTAPLLPTTPARARFPAWLIGVAGAVIAGIVVFLLLRPGSGGGNATVTALAIDGAPAALTVGDRVSLATRATDGTGKTVPSGPVRWSTSDTLLAVVSGDGVMQARAPGSVELRAAAGGQTAAVTITIRQAAVAAVAVAPRDARVTLGETLQLVAEVRDRDGRILAGRAVNWSSTAPRVVSVTSDGVVTAQAIGTATVGASSEGQSGAATITVFRREQPAPAPAPTPRAVALAVRPDRLTLQVGQTASLSAAAGGRTARVSWSVADPAVASVSAAGVVTGVRAGITTVTAAGTGYNAGSATITVTAPAAPAPTALAMLQMIVRPWANVTIDGVAKGQRTRALDTLSAGIAHSVRLEHPSSVTIDTIITLRPGERRQITFEMKPRSP